MVSHPFAAFNVLVNLKGASKRCVKQRWASLILTQTLTRIIPADYNVKLDPENIIHPPAVLFFLKLTKFLPQKR